MLGRLGSPLNGCLHWSSFFKVYASPLDIHAIFTFVLCGDIPMTTAALITALTTMIVIPMTTMLWDDIRYLISFPQRLRKSQDLAITTFFISSSSQFGWSAGLWCLKMGWYYHASLSVLQKICSVSFLLFLVKPYLIAKGGGSEQFFFCIFWSCSVLVLVWIAIPTASGTSRVVGTRVIKSVIVCLYYTILSSPKVMEFFIS